MLLGEIKQYYVNYIFYNLGIVILFCGIFFNYYFNQSENNAIAMLISAVLWQICSSAIQYYTYLIQDEAMMGTLEQMFLTKTSFGRIIISKTIVNMGFVLIKGGFIFLMCICVFFRRLMSFKITLVQAGIIFCLFIITVVVFYGIGGFFGGLSLYFKRISSVTNVVNYFLLMFTGVLKNPSDYNDTFEVITKIIPITNANILIGEVINGSVKQEDIIRFFFSSVLFLVIGIVGMNVMLDYARKDGKLGQY